MTFDMKGILRITRLPGRRAATLILAIIFVCLFSTASFASWTQSISEDGVYNGTTYLINKIEVFKLDGTSGFASPGMSNFSAGTWTVQMPNTSYVVATNVTTGINNFNWLFSFTGSSTDSLHLAYLAYTTTGQVFGSYLNYNYGGSSTWNFPTITNLNVNDPTYNRTPSSVPIPPAVFLFSIGLLSLVGLRKKFKD